MAISTSHPAKAASRGGNPCGRMLEETLTSAGRDSLRPWNREGRKNAAVGPENSEEPVNQCRSVPFPAGSLSGRRTVRADGSGIHLVETLPVQDMRCPTCARKVKTALLGCPGVMRAEVSLAFGQATVRFDPNRSSLDELKAAVRAAGYGTASNVGKDVHEPLGAPKDSSRTAADRAMALNVNRSRTGGKQMEERKVHIPAISCMHCITAIKREIGKMEGVTGVEGNVETKLVTIRWGSPATWEKITGILAKIGYPAVH